MDHILSLLSLGAVTLALVHTLCGPDHYVPFVAMSRVGNWSLRKTMIVTLLSGLGHVASAVLLGFAGIAAGHILTHLELIEHSRGKAAGGLLIVVGVIYFTWGIIHVQRNRSHVHCHIHGASPHSHEHLGPNASFSEGLKRPRETGDSRGTAPQAARLTPWVLFTIVVFGPCELLIPLLMYPAAQVSLWGVLLVTLLFAVTTIGTMLLLFLCLVQGTQLIHFFCTPAVQSCAGWYGNNIVLVSYHVRSLASITSCRIDGNRLDSARSLR